MQKLIVSNLPRWITEIHLKQFFNSCGKIVHASIALDSLTLRPKGFGYLIFADDEGMERAIKKDGAILDGSLIKVQLASEAVDEVVV